MRVDSSKYLFIQHVLVGHIVQSDTLLGVCSKIASKKDHSCSLGVYVLTQKTQQTTYLMGSCQENYSKERVTRKKSVLVVMKYFLIRGHLNKNQNKMKERIKKRTRGRSQIHPGNMVTKCAENLAGL